MYIPNFFAKKTLKTSVALAMFGCVVIFSFVFFDAKISVAQSASGGGPIAGQRFTLFNSGGGKTLTQPLGTWAFCTLVEDKIKESGGSTNHSCRIDGGLNGAWTLVSYVGDQQDGQCSAFCVKDFPLPAGTIIGKATLDGKDWDSPAFTESYTGPDGVTHPNTTIDPPVTYTNMPAGTYTLNSVTPPSGVTLKDVNGSSLAVPYSITLPAGGTITVTYNFVTIPPSTGTIIVKTTKDGIAWDSPPFQDNYTHVYPDGSAWTGDVTLDTDASGQQTFTGATTGTYTVNNIVPPSGVTFKNVNGFPLPYGQTLTAGGTITYTFNFVTTVIAPPPSGTLFISNVVPSTVMNKTFVTFNITGGGFGSPTTCNDIKPVIYDTFYFTSYGCNSDTSYTITGSYGVSATKTFPFQSYIYLWNASAMSNKYPITVTAFIAPVVPTLTVTPASATVQVGGTQQFNAVYDPDGSGPQSPLYVTNSSLWSSSNNSVAGVSSTGVASGSLAGPATITASYSGLTASAALSVTAPTPVLNVIPSSASVAIGDTHQFAAFYDPDGTGPQLPQDVTATAAWSPSDETQVTVNGGLATRVGRGMALVTASYSELSDSADVLDPATLRVSPSSATLSFGTTVQLAASYDPDGAGSEPALDVTLSAGWSSNRPTIANVDTVSSKGLVTAGSATTGSATVSAAYNGLTATARITVTAPELSVSCSASPASTVTGQSVIWTATATGGTGSYSYSWSGSSPLGIPPFRDGNPIALTNGYSTPGTKTGSVRVTSSSQSVSKECDTSVTVDTPPLPPLATLLVNGATTATIDKGQSATLTWTSTNGATRCDSPDFSTDGLPNNTSPGVQVSPSTDTTYHIYCTNAGGPGPQASVSVTVVSPKVSISASPTCISGGGSSRISWSATPASQVASCNISGPGLSSSQLTGSQTVNVTSKSSYTIACITTGGSTITKSVIVDVSGCWSEF